MDKKVPGNFSDALQELEGLTAEFENGEIDLEKGIPKFKRGMELVRFLKKRLNEIENEIEEIKEQFKDVEEVTISPGSADETDFQDAHVQNGNSEDSPF